jgi:flagellar biosynthesis chaperone FliJ
MKTENRIFANLQKFKSQKQNLGAIEDAISEVKNNLQSKKDELSVIVQNYVSEVNDCMDKIDSEIDYLISSTSATEKSFDDLLLEYSEMYDELTSAGIEFSNTDMDNIITEFDDTVKIAKNLTLINMQNL